MAEEISSDEPIVNNQGMNNFTYKQHSQMVLLIIDSVKCEL